MKKLIILSMLAIFSYNIEAQVITKPNLYHENWFSINPASANSANLLSFNSSISSIGIDKAPQVSRLFANGSISENSGIGIKMQMDKRGQFNSKNISAAYSYKLIIGDNKKHIINAGIAMGGSFDNFDINGIDAETNDPLINYNSYSKKHFTAEIGFSYNYKHLNVGATVFHKQNEYNSIIAYSSYDIKLLQEEDFILTPIVLYHQMPEGMGQFDVTAKIKHKPFWTSLTYRSNNNLLMVLGTNINIFRFSYSYEYNNMDVSAFTGGIHEIMLSYSPDFSKKAEGKLVEKDDDSDNIKL
ncbi:MAG: PorP/SprF family type IX secretion system membrane protein [Ichthyobacteriaceae bacterium]|nr:PorP/SprF family type IX secretion system membrane protein [Ichthyobacteriaceae bacterium]